MLIISAKSQLTNFAYNESVIDTGYSLFVQNLQTYDDGITLVHITRRDPTINTNCSVNLGLSSPLQTFGLEQLLRLRVIQLNGSVIEINLDLNLITPNYCVMRQTSGGIVFPIKIYALQKPLILVTYVNATNSSDPNTYEEWGTVIDWYSNIRSNIYFGPSFVDNSNNHWSPQSSIELNINKKLGFFRLAFIRKDDPLNPLCIPLSQFTNPQVKLKSFQLVAMSTIDGGYALFYANSTENVSSNRTLAIRGTVYANFISYNKTVQDRTILLYELDRNVTFNGIYCDLVAVGFGQVCTLSIDYTNTTINPINNSTINNSTTSYVRIYFLTSGSVLKIDVLSELPNITSIPLQGWMIKAMAFGGYILHAGDAVNYAHIIYPYDEYNFQVPLVSAILPNGSVFINNNFSTNPYGANAIMNNNNTFLLPSFNINDPNTLWSLQAIPLPKVLEDHDHGYGNLQIDKVNPPINSGVDPFTATLSITFYDPVILSVDKTSGHITIYKTSDNSIRQQISPTMNDFCKISLDGKTLYINIINSAFNQYGESYHVQMDNNFVKSKLYNEPLKGIGDGIWNLTSNVRNNVIAFNSSVNAIVGLVGITKDAKEKFLSLSSYDRSKYFMDLLNEISIKVPIRRSRLSTNKRFQHNDYGKPEEQIIFSIKIDVKSPDSDENTVDSVVSDIYNMITYKEITTFSNGLTNDLDKNFGFEVMSNLLVDNQTLIVVSILVLIAITILYILTFKDVLKNFNAELIKILHTFSSYAIIATNFFFTSYFVIMNSIEKPNLFLPSIIIWSIQIGINFIMVIVMLIYISELSMPTKDDIIKAFKNFGISIYEIFKSIINYIKNMNEKIFSEAKEMYNKMAIYAKLEEEQPLVENIKDLVIISIEKDPDLISKKNDTKKSDEKFDKNKYYEIIGEVIKENKHDSVHIIKNDFENSEKLSKIFDRKKDEISNQIKSEINHIPEILKRIFENSHDSSCSNDLKNIKPEDITTEIQSTTKLLQVSIKIHHEFHEEKRKLILAEIHIGIAVIILDKLVDILLDEFFILLEKKFLNTIKDKISTIKKSKKKSGKDEEFEDELTNGANNIKNEIFNKFKHIKIHDLKDNEEIFDGQEVSIEQSNNSIKISKEIEYKILNKFYKQISNESSDVEVTFNEEQKFTEIEKKISEQIQQIIQNEYFLRNIYNKIDNELEIYGKIDSELEIYDRHKTLIEEKKKETLDHEEQKTIDQIHECHEWAKNHLHEIFNKIYNEETSNKKQDYAEIPKEKQDYAEISNKIKNKISDQIHKRIEKKYFFEILKKIYEDEDGNYDKSNKISEKFFNDENNKPLNEEPNEIIEKTYRYENNKPLYEEPNETIEKNYNDENNKSLNKESSEQIRSISKKNRRSTLSKAQTYCSNVIQNDHTKISYKVDRIKKIFSGTLKKALHVKEDILMDMKHMLFIIFVIFDSESLIFMNDITEDYIKKITYINVNKGRNTHDIIYIEERVKAVEACIKKAIRIKDSSVKSEFSESASSTTSPGSAPQVVNVQTYDNGAILVSVARKSDSQKQKDKIAIYNSLNCTLIFENILRLRVIQTDGKIKEINSNLNLDPVNYCIFNDPYGNPVNPINIYTLHKQFILVNYVKVDSGNYEEWGSVIDWSGNSLSDVHYGPSYINSNGSWSPQSIIQLNVNKKQGFFRFNTVRVNGLDRTEWQQYLVDDSGKISKLTNNSISLNDPNSNNSIITTISTVTGGYAILCVNSSINYNTSTLTTRSGLYINVIPYNQSTPSDQVLLYQLTLPNIIFLGLYCDIAPNSIGYMCIIEISYNSQLNYIKVHFLTSESVTSINILSNIPDISAINFTSRNLGMQAMTFGGYLYYAMAKNNSYYIWPYDENDQMLTPLGPFSANEFTANVIYNNINRNNLNSAVSIMGNNTFIIASNTSSQSTSWSLLFVPLPRLYEDTGYGNLQIFNIMPPPIKPPNDGTIDSSTTSLNITFNRSVILSTGSITIYKSSDNTIRQTISATMSDYVKFMDKNHTIVSITILSSTFNQYGENYYLQMDANFVRDEMLSEPLTGINEGIVKFTSKEAAICLARLTTVATEKFKNLANANKTDYFKALLQEISKKLPVRTELLSTDNNYQYLTINSKENAQFAIRVDKTNPKIDNYTTVPGIVSDLDKMIRNKRITTFSNGLTNDLDETYGFKPRGNILGDYKFEIIPLFSAGAGNLLVYIFSQFSSDSDDFKQMLNVVSSGLFTATHTSFSGIFAFSDAKNYPLLSLPSGGVKKLKFVNLLTILLALYNSETLLLVNGIKLQEIFDEKFEPMVKYRAFADIFIKNTPQLVIQVKFSL
ncbi:17254_t:CDS:10 [Cetraspora pellucida]|uniref:17254_t:CDS:1 n=1 Tax=Cetraspora pellucida TaxID=1433469 RepID=A0A9N8VY02_9GLOM|nr:17254_t:CDS:10 [Cetraspora pellucida]